MNENQRQKKLRELFVLNAGAHAHRREFEQKAAKAENHGELTRAKEYRVLVKVYQEKIEKLAREVKDPQR